jgi:hypothetical protein
MLWDVYVLDNDVIVKGNAAPFTILELQEFYAELPADLFAFSLPTGSDLPSCLSGLLCD